MRGLEALAILSAARHVDMVVSDLRMPNMDGWELAEQLRTRVPRIPVLLISGYHIHTSTDSLPEPVLPKPFSLEQFVGHVRQLLVA